MMHCLTGSELKQVLAFHESDARPESEEVNAWVESSLGWEDELVGLSYVFSQLLLAAKKRGVRCDELIELFYAIGDRSWFTVAECDSVCVEYMLRTCRDSNLALADDLLQLENKLRLHDYADIIRL